MSDSRYVERRNDRYTQHRRPVAPLEMALYGHPDSGGFWEMHCEKKLMRAGFRKASEMWARCCRNAELQCFLVVCVDDMKLAGPKAKVAEAWGRLRAEIKMDPPEDA